MIKRRFKDKTRQSGVSLMELLIAMTISLVVSLAMISLMANTLGTGTTTIKMSRLTAEMRTAMQIMTRDLRRANYHGNYIKCFGDVDCRTKLDTIGGIDSSATSHIKAITVDGGDCFFYWFDRDSDGIVTSGDAVGAFRRGVRSGIGTIEMTTVSSGTPNCDSNTDWALITDPNIVDVTAFVVTNNLGYTETISKAGATQFIDKIRLRIVAQLVTDPGTNRTIEDVIQVRNPIFSPAP